MKKIFTITFVAVSSFIFSCKKETTISNESTAVSSMEVTSALHSGTSTSPLVWQVCMGTTADEYGFAVAKAGDGGYFVVGTTNGNHDGYFAKLDNNHLVKNTGVVGGSGVENLHGVVSTDDGGCLAVGATSSSETPGFMDGSDMFLVKIDVNGAVQWQKAIGIPGSQQANTIIRTSDGNFALTGYSDAQLPFIKIDPAGNVLQQVYFSYSPATTANFGYGIVQTGNDYIVSGWTHVPNNTAEDGLLLVKFVSDGTITPARFYTGFDSHGWGIVSNSGGSDFTIVGDNGNMVLLKVRPDLSKIYDKTFSNMDGRSIVSIPDGYLIVGTQSNNLMAFRVDNNFNTISDNTFGGGRVETGRSVIVDTDGGYVAIGTTNSTNGIVTGNHGGNDIWTVKVKY